MRLKYAIFSYLLLFSSFAFSGYDNNSGAGDYDLDSGLYFKTVPSNGENNSDVSSKISNNFAINLFVFNPKDNTYRHLLNKNYGQITSYVIETAFEKSNVQDDRKSIINGSYKYLSGLNHVQNNTNIPQRAIHQNIIIETYNSKTEKYTVWKANKLIGAAQVIFTYSQPAHWHLDVNNQQIRLITPVLENKQVRLRIKSYSW